MTLGMGYPELGIQDTKKDRPSIKKDGR